MLQEPARELLEQGLGLLKNENLSAAHNCFKRAIQMDHPQTSEVRGLIANYGYTLAMVEGREREGLNYIHKGIQMDLYHPDGFLNLGRFYLYRKRNRKKALNAFYNGLRHCPSDPEIVGILQDIGTRKKPVIRFLSRQNFLNRYLGIYLRRKKTKRKTLKKRSKKK